MFSVKCQGRLIYFEFRKSLFCFAAARFLYLPRIFSPLCYSLSLCPLRHLLFRAHFVVVPCIRASYNLGIAIYVLKFLSIGSIADMSVVSAPSSSSYRNPYRSRRDYRPPPAAGSGFGRLKYDQDRAGLLPHSRSFDKVSRTSFHIHMTHTKNITL